MDKHEALEALEKAHKLRKHADKIEREAHEILDKREERHEEDHEVKASFGVLASDEHPAGIAHGHKHSLIAALHRQLKIHHRDKAATSTGDEARKHAGLSEKHDRAGKFHTAKSEASLRPHFSKMARNIIHEENYDKAAKHVGDPLEKNGSFKPAKARRAVAHFTNW